jgi:DnaK suppressor protein
VGRVTLDPGEFAALLRRRREDILQAADSSRQAARPVELDQSRVGRLSRMDDLQSQAMSLAAGERLRLELRRIAEALQRLDDGEYGYCLECGEQISVGRLRIDPAATHCIECARRRERP